MSPFRRLLRWLVRRDKTCDVFPEPDASLIVISPFPTSHPMPEGMCRYLGRVRNSPQLVMVLNVGKQPLGAGDRVGAYVIKGAVTYVGARIPIYWTDW